VGYYCFYLKAQNNVIINKATIESNVNIRSNVCLGNGEDIILIEEGKDINADSKILTKL